MSRQSNRDELYSGSIANTSNSLLRIAGGWGNIGGPGLFMIRTLVSGTVTALFAGMTGALMAASIYGTGGLPFVLCSCVGFAVGAFGFYNDAVRRSMVYLDRYPRLLQIYLDANFPAAGFDRWPRERLHSSRFDTWPLRSMLVVSWLGATPAIENIIDNAEQEAVSAEAALETNFAAGTPETIDAAD